MRAPVSFAMARHCSTSPASGQKDFRCHQADIIPFWPRRPSASCPCCCARRQIGKAQLRQGFARRVLQHGHPIGEDLGGVELVVSGRSIPARPRTRPSSSTRWPDSRDTRCRHAAQHAGRCLSSTLYGQSMKPQAEVGDLRAWSNAPTSRRSGCEWRFFKIRAMFFPTRVASHVRLFGGLQFDGEVDPRYWISAGV